MRALRTCSPFLAQQRRGVKQISRAVTIIRKLWCLDRPTHDVRSGSVRNCTSCETERNLWGPSDRLDGFATGLIVGQGTEIRLVLPRLIAFSPLRTR